MKKKGPESIAINIIIGLLFIMGIYTICKVIMFVIAFVNAPWTEI